MGRTCVRPVRFSDRDARDHPVTQLLQGVLARRPSRLHVRVELAGGDVKGVKVGGAAAVVGDGTMTPP